MQDIRLPLVLVATLLASLSQAHSWVEELRMVGPNGTFVGSPGYPRGYIPRTAPGFKDPMMQWQLPTNQGHELKPDMPMCRPTQETSNYTNSAYPQLTVNRQSNQNVFVSLRYQENGHVTTTWAKAGKPMGSGIVYVYGTTQPKPDAKFLDIFKQWKAYDASKTTEQPDVLLTAQYFDDGQCYQINVGDISLQRQAQYPRVPGPGSSAGADLWCQTDVYLPYSLYKSGQEVTLYWVWDWSTIDESGHVTLPELYTSCMDVLIKDDSEKVARDTGSTATAENFQSALFFATPTNYGENAIETIWSSPLAFTDPAVLTAAKTPLPVNITASVSYQVAVSVFQANANIPPSAATEAARASGAAAASAFLQTYVPSSSAAAAAVAGSNTAAVPASIPGTVVSATPLPSPAPPPPAAASNVAPDTAPVPPNTAAPNTAAPNAAAAGSAIGAANSQCTAMPVTFTQTQTVTQIQSQFMTVTVTAPNSGAAPPARKRDGFVTRRMVPDTDDEHYIIP